MKFLSIFTLPQSQLTPPTPDEMAAMDRLVEESIASGVIISTGMFPFPGAGFRIQRENGVCAVSDLIPDPNAVRCGYGLIQAETREDAIRIAERFLVHVGQGTCEVIELAVAATRGPVFGDVDLKPARREQVA